MRRKLIIHIFILVLMNSFLSCENSTTATNGSNNDYEPQSLENTIIIVKSITESNEQYDALYKASILESGDIGTPQRILRYKENSVLMPTYGLDISNDGKWIWLGIGALSGVNPYSASIYGCSFFKVSSDGTNSAGATIAGYDIDVAGEISGQGKLNINVRDSQGLSVSGASVLVRGNSLGTTSANGDTEINSLVFKDGVSWVYVYHQNKFGYSEIVFTGGTLNVDISLNMDTFPKARKVGVNENYRLLHIGLMTNGIFPFNSADEFRVKNGEYANISPANNFVYYQPYSSNSYGINIIKYDIKNDIEIPFWEFPAYTEDNGSCKLSTFMHQFEFSRDGKKVYFVVSFDDLRAEAIYSLNTNSQNGIAEFVYASSTSSYEYMGDIAVSPDGNFVYFVKNGNLYKVNSNGSTAQDSASLVISSGDIKFIATTLE